MILFLSAVAVVLLVVLTAVKDVHRKRNLRLPPGPPGRPILGNLLQLPETFLFRKLHSWSKQYGNFYSFWIMGQPFVVIGDVSTAADVLDRMSGATSDRPPMRKARQFYFRDMMTILQDRTLVWRAQRRAMHASLNIRAAAQYNPMQAHDSAYMTLAILQHPELPFGKHTHRFVASAIIRALYGGDPLPLVGPDPSELMERLAYEGARACMPQNSWVDTFPALEPLIRRIKFLRRAGDEYSEETDQEATRLFDGALPIDVSRLSITCTDDLPSDSGLGSEHAREQCQNERGQVRAVEASCDLDEPHYLLYMAAQETSYTALRIFGLAMLHHPNVIRMAQEQLDAVCGERLPSFADRDQLPYIQAIIKESLRWRSGVPLGLPHVASEEFEYRGFVIPKGTVLLDNLWSQTRDSSVYEDPETFNPSRFLDSSGMLRPVTPDTRLDQLGFGHGRRACPGRDFAFNSMFIACAQLLWAFDWDWPTDEKGEKIVCGTDDFVDSGVVVGPKQFEVVLTPRKEGLEARLLAAVKE